MIAACPKCGTRYRLERERLKPEGVRIRCRRCSAIFRLRPPQAPQPGVARGEVPSSQAPQPGAAQRPPATSGRPAATAESELPAYDRQRLVLVAQADVAQCKDTADALSRLGLETVMAHDGVEAILTLQRTLPRAAVLDAALTKMYGFQICELVKRNESLRATWLILVGALHHPDRSHRPANDLYGADAYVEPSELPDALPPLLRRFGLPLREPSAAQAGSCQPLSRPQPASPPPEKVEASAAAPAAPASPEQPLHDGLDEQRAKAERLARIIISDIILYNEEKFAAAIRSQDPLGTMVEELEEGRALFRQRIDARVREERDHLTEELLRVVRARSGS
jgi:predicted Zn finger-like uncharacterized protein